MDRVLNAGLFSCVTTLDGLASERERTTLDVGDILVDVARCAQQTARTSDYHMDQVLHKVMFSHIKAGDSPRPGSRSATASFEITVQVATSRDLVLFHAHVAYQGTFFYNA